MSIITIISDFGYTDHYVAAIKASIYKLNSNLNVVDISHDIKKYNISHAAHSIRNVYKDFPTIGKKKKLSTVLITFKPNTNKIIHHNKEHKQIMSHENKINHLNKLNIEYLCTIDFNNKFSNLDIDEFMNIIINKYDPHIFIIGYDNCFGKNRMGNYEYLSNDNKYKNILFIEEKPYKINNEVVKTSYIKKLILSHKINTANEYLGYKYSIQCKVIHGEKVGRTIGFPTANMKIIKKEQLIPPNGVYSVNLIHDNKSYPAVCNIGYRPTINKSNNIVIEAHIINKEINLYDKVSSTGAVRIRWSIFHDLSEACSRS